MKKLLVVLMMSAFSLTSYATDDFDTQDRWPWNWGTECPFPWKTINGDWTVKSLVETGDYHGHRLEIEVEDDSEPDSKLLMVTQYNEDGRLVATGEGYTESNDRVITAYMSPVKSGKKVYKVIVRSYDKRTTARTSQKKCTKRNRIHAATFCSPRGRKCLKDSNYILE